MAKIFLAFVMLAQSVFAAKDSCVGPMSTKPGNKPKKSAKKEPGTALVAAPVRHEIARPNFELQEFRPIGFDSVFGPTVPSRALGEGRFIRSDAQIYANEKGYGDVAFGQTGEPPSHNSIQALARANTHSSTSLTQNSKNRGLVSPDQMLRPAFEAGNTVAQMSGITLEKLQTLSEDQVYQQALTNIHEIARDRGKLDTFQTALDFYLKNRNLVSPTNDNVNNPSHDYSDLRDIEYQFNFRFATYRAKSLSTSNGENFFTFAPDETQKLTVARLDRLYAKGNGRLEIICTYIQNGRYVVKSLSETEFQTVIPQPITESLGMDILEYLMPRENAQNLAQLRAAGFNPVNYDGTESMNWALSGNRNFYKILFDMTSTRGANDPLVELPQKSLKEVLSLAALHDQPVGWAIDRAGNMRAFLFPMNADGQLFNLKGISQFFLGGSAILAEGYVSIKNNEMYVFLLDRNSYSTEWTHRGDPVSKAHALAEYFYNTVGVYPRVTLHAIDADYIQQVYNSDYYQSAKAYYYKQADAQSRARQRSKKTAHNNSGSKSSTYAAGNSKSGTKIDLPPWGDDRLPINRQDYIDLIREKGGYDTPEMINDSWARWILGVSERADQSEIKSAYIRLYKKYHTDATSQMSEDAYNKNLFIAQVVGEAKAILTTR